MNLVFRPYLNEVVVGDSFSLLNFGYMLLFILLIGGWVASALPMFKSVLGMLGTKKTVVTRSAPTATPFTSTGIRLDPDEPYYPKITPYPVQADLPYEGVTSTPWVTTTPSPQVIEITPEVTWLPTYTPVTATPTEMPTMPPMPTVQYPGWTDTVFICELPLCVEVEPGIYVYTAPEE